MTGVACFTGPDRPLRGRRSRGLSGSALDQVALLDKNPIRCSVVLQLSTKISCFWRTRDQLNGTLIRRELRRPFSGGFWRTWHPSV
jgi:hypothetical protein